MADKKFFQIRLREKSTLKTKIVNGVSLTKQWQVKVGEIGDFAKFSDVEAQVVIKQGNSFVPVGEANKGATEGSGGGSGQTPGNASAPVGNTETTQKTENQEVKTPPDFPSMTVEQLKSFLIANGAAQTEIRTETKSELIERAEFIWSQK